MSEKINASKLLFDFIEDHRSLMEKEYQKRWQKITELLDRGLLEKNTSHFYLEKAIEDGLRLNEIKTLFEYNEDHKNNVDIYKWACAKSSIEVIKYLENRIVFKNIPSAITAAICHYRLDVLEYMLEAGHKVITEPNFCMAIGRSGQLKKTFILDFFKQNIEKMHDLTSYSAEAIRTSWMYDNYQTKQTRNYADGLVNLINSSLLEKKLQEALDSNDKPKSHIKKI